MFEFSLFLFHVSVPPHTFAVLLLIGGFLAIVGCLETVTNGGKEMNSAIPRVQSASGDIDHTTTAD